MQELVCRADVELLLKGLLQPPVDPQQDFLCGGETRADIYAMAAHLYADFVEIGSEVPVCLAAERRSVIAAALLAALASGTVLVLPHSFSQSALEQMREVTGFNAAVVDVERDLASSIQRISCDKKNSANISLPVKNISADAELLQIFTGGSTGTPKIWSKSAGNIFGEALFMASRYQINSRDVILSTVSPYHIYGLLFSVVIPLVASASVLAETPSFPVEIVESVQRQSATILVSVPTHYRILRGRSVGTSLRVAFSSAGMLEKEDSLEFSGCNDVGVVEVYGSTETGGLASRDRSTGQEFFTPLAPVIWQIVEERLYVQSPFLSADLSVSESGFFLSGDRVRREGDNAFSLHGRADAITKVGGIRVDLDEVRDFLQRQSAVQECVVVPLIDKGGRGNLIAALVRGEGVDVAQLKKVMATTLEPAAQPKRIKVVSVIPVAPSGKYDREAICKLLLPL